MGSLFHTATEKNNCLSQYLFLPALSGSQMCGHPFLHFSAVGHDSFKNGEWVGADWLLFVTSTCFVVSLQCQEGVV